MSVKASSASLGQEAEHEAARFLERAGLSIVCRNFRCREGEIDLICQDGKSLVFVEVRMRKNADFGGAGASITRAKQKRIIHAAEHYLVKYKKTNLACRFDCVLIEGGAIEWLKNAFSLD